MLTNSFCDYIVLCNNWQSLQVPPLSQWSPVLTSLEMSVELWMWLWAGLWVVETVLISTSSTLPPMLPRPRMGDFWTSPLPVSHSMNWLVSWQDMSIISQYMVWTVCIRRGMTVTPWQSHFKVWLRNIIYGSMCGDNYVTVALSQWHSTNINAKCLDITCIFAIMQGYKLCCS